MAKRSTFTGSRTNFNKYGFREKKRRVRTPAHSQGKSANPSSDTPISTARLNVERSREPSFNEAAEPRNSKKAVGSESFVISADTPSRQLSFMSIASRHRQPSVTSSVPQLSTSVMNTPKEEVIAKPVVASVNNGSSSASSMLLSPLYVRPSVKPTAPSSSGAMTGVMSVTPARTSIAVPTSLTESTIVGISSARRFTSEILTVAMGKDPDTNLIHPDRLLPANNMAMRFITPQTLRGIDVKDSLDCAPSHICHPKKRAHSPYSSSSQVEATVMNTLDETGRPLPQYSVFRDNQSVNSKADGNLGIEAISASSHARYLEPASVLGNAPLVSSMVTSPASLMATETVAAPDLTFTSTAPKLVASSGGYEEYTITTTYRMPRDSAFDSPQVSVMLPARKPAPIRTSDSVTSLNEHQILQSIGERHKPDRSKFLTASRSRSNSNTRAAARHLVTVASENRYHSKRKQVRSRTPIRFYRYSPIKRLTPTRLSTPVCEATPSRRFIPFTRATPAPRSRLLPFKATTPRRKEHWKKIMSNMAEYQRRRALFPRRKLFTEPIRENITLARLETFWKILSDLIAHAKLFNRSMWDHWEYIGPCVRMVNERLAGEKAFGIDEGCAAARELMRQRLVMFMGNGKLMLTRNAL